MTKKITRRIKENEGTNKANLPLAKRGYQPYMGTLSMSKVNLPKVAWEADSTRPRLEGSTHGIITHEVPGCGAHTAIWLHDSELGKPFSYTCSGCGQKLAADQILKRDLRDQQFTIYGDESSYGNFSVYGFVLLHNEDVQNAEREVQGILQEYSKQPDARLHCRQLFDDSVRKQSKFADLKKEQVWEMVRSILRALGNYKATYFLGIADRSTWPKELPGKAGPISISRDHMYPLAFQAALKALEERGFLRDGVKLKVYLDPQKNKVEFSGAGRTMVESFMKSSVPTAQLPTTNKPLLLDAADLFSYIGAHAFREQGAADHKIFGGMLHYCAPAVGVARWAPSDQRRGFQLEEVEGVFVKPKEAIGSSAPSDPASSIDLTVPDLPPARGWSVTDAPKVPETA